MKYILIPLVFVALSLFTVGATITFPKIQVIEFEEVVLKSGSKKQLCDKYHNLFMEMLHESLTCSEDREITPKDEERCSLVMRLLEDYSRLRSKYCYDEDWDEIKL
jgi:hypothetical protein